jgi:precorrin-6B methylase 2
MKFNNGMVFDTKGGSPSAWRRYKLIKLHEPIEEIIFHQILLNHEIKTYINMGANIGYYSILAKVLSPETHVIAIEGERKNIPKIKKNMKLNDISEIEIINKWVGAKRKKLNLEQLLAPFKNIELLSMDIQGAEVNVLKELISTKTIRKVERLLIGTHHVEKTHHACLEMLEKQFYKIHFQGEPRKVWQQPDGIVWAERTNKQPDEQPWKLY